MPLLNELTEPMRPVLNLFYVLDTSGSMRGQAITTLNRAMRATLDAVRLVAEQNGKARVKVSVLEFNSNARWFNPNMAEDLDVFLYEELSAGGGTNMGRAIRELNSKLSREGFINAESGNLMPVIIFMTDGRPTDDYEHELDRARRNKWFTNAARIGFAIGKADTKMIANLTGTSEAVIRTEDLGVFARLLEMVSITSTMLQSESRTTEGRSIGAMAVSDAKREAGYAPDDFTPDFRYQEPIYEDGTWGLEELIVDSGDYGTGTFR